MIRIGNKVVAGSVELDLSTVLKSLNKTGLSYWIGTQTEYEALSDTIKNNEKTTFITYDTDKDVYIIVDTIISYGKTWSSVKISSELAKKINAMDVYTKQQVDEIIASKLASALKYKGTVNTTALLPVSATNGDTYFVKADGFMYAYNSTESNWDALGTVADMTNYFTRTEITAMLQDKADKFQYDVLPTPSAETVGLLLQYTGADTEKHKNGYFYKGIDNGDNTYDWGLAKTDDYYSKSEADNLLNSKVNIADITNVVESGNTNPVSSDGVANTLRQKGAVTVFVGATMTGSSTEIEFTVPFAIDSVSNITSLVAIGRHVEGGYIDADDYSQSMQFLDTNHTITIPSKGNNYTSFMIKKNISYKKGTNGSAVKNNTPIVLELRMVIA